MGGIVGTLRNVAIAALHGEGLPRVVVVGVGENTMMMEGDDRRVGQELIEVMTDIVKTIRGVRSDDCVRD